MGAAQTERRINIQQIALEPHKKEVGLWKRTEEIVSLIDWDRVAKDVDKIIEPTEFALAVRNVVIISPKQNRYVQKPEQSVREDLEARKEPVDKDLLIALAAMNLILPDFGPTQIPAKLFPDINKVLSDWRKSPYKKNLVFTVAGLNFQMLDDLRADEDFISWLSEELDSISEDEYMQRQVELKILTNKPVVNDKPEINEMTEAYQIVSRFNEKGYTSNFLEGLAYLKILAAQEVKISEKGLELIPPDADLRINIPPVPATREF